MKRFILVLALFILAASVVSLFFLQKNQKSGQLESPRLSPVIVANKSAPLESDSSSSSSSSSSGDIEFLIGKSEVLFKYLHPKSDVPLLGFVSRLTPDTNEKLFRYLKDDTPNYGYLRISQIPVATENSPTFFIRHSYHDHADLGTNYGMVFDPVKNKILYETGGLFDKGRLKTVGLLNNGDIYLDYIFGYSSPCNLCGIGIADYYRYDPAQGQYLSVNTKYKDDFSERLKGMEADNKCYADFDKGLELTFSEIKEKYGENFQCQLHGVEWSGTSDDVLITPKIYFTIKDAMERIIRGEELEISKLSL